MKTLHFMAGLPRTGSTMLTSLLHQNPRINGAPISGLCGIFAGTHANWDTNDFHIETPNPAAKKAVLRGVLENYYQNVDRPIIIDKNRAWLSHIELLEHILERPIKVIVTVRPIVEILASFEYLRKKQILNVTLADSALGVNSTLEQRAEYYTAPKGVIGFANNALKDAVQGGYLDRLLFVDYNKLAKDPQKELSRIYAFLNEEKFDHHLDDITLPVESDSSVHKFEDLHVVRTDIKKESPDPEKILGDEVFKKYNRLEPWLPWV